MSGYIGDINNKAKKIKSLYVGDVNNKARKVKSAYIGVNRLARKWYGEYPPGPNDQYESISLGTWRSITDVNNFFNTYKPQNGWSGLQLGNYVTIQDGTYNTEWEIAGFNMEHNQIAADGTTYDNGYGICMIPKTALPNMSWNDTNTLVGGYKASTMNTSHLVTVANNLKTILGDHLVQRNVLLSSECNGTYPRANTSSAYEWTTAYCTLMSIGQMTGTFAQYNNKYDDGEANYKLPLFDHEDFTIGSNFWSRFVWGYSTNGNYAGFIGKTGGIGGNGVNAANGVRPLIYLR